MKAALRNWLAAVGAAVFALSATACAGTPPAAERTALDELARIRQASDQLTYSGVFVYQQGREVRSSRITHSREAGGGREKLQMLDGQPREFLRRADEVRALMPEVRTVLVEQARSHDTAFPAFLRADPSQLLQHYRLRRISAERVALFETDGLELEPLDALRYGYRLFADRRTGLLLKAQTIDERGDVVEQMAFTELRIGGPLEKGSLEASWNTRGWKVERTATRSVDLSAWRLTKPVAGFNRITEVQRSLAGHGEVSQIVFSDGRAAVSIFIEAAPEAGAPAKAVKAADAGSPATRETMSAEGSVNVFSRRYGAYLITVLGEAPAAAIRQFADALELSKPATP
ncbi:MucB/RseB C-terminal domain-containing protein [soil metagenome]